MKKIWGFWKNYWFRPAPLLDLAICRILIVGFHLYNLDILYPPFYRFNLLAGLPDDMYRPLPILRLLNWPIDTGFRPPVDLLEIIFWITVVAGLLAFIGWKTNLSLIVLAVGSVYMQTFLYSFQELHHPPAIMLITLSILALAPAGAVLSLDDLIRRRREAVRSRRFEEVSIAAQTSVFSRWPLLLVQWTFGLIYFSSAYSKLSRSGLDWMNGYTLQYYLARDGFRWGIPLGQWMSEYHFLAQLGSIVAVLFQLTFFLVPMFPVLGIIYLPLGLSFHALVYVMMGAPFFTWMFLYVVFVPWSRLIKFAEWLKSGSSNKGVDILYDGECPLCLRSMTLLSYFDWFGQLRYSDIRREWPRVAKFLPGMTKEDCLREMYVLLPDGSAPNGFFAFRQILWKVPPFWPLLFLFYFPLASSVGPKIYGFIASRRLRFTHCESGACIRHDSE